MRKVILQVQVSIDGFVGGPAGEMDWMVSNWDEALKDYIKEATKHVDTILLGRKLAEVFIPYWAAAASGPDGEEKEAGEFLNPIPKVVFTNSLQTSPWENTVLAKGKLAEEIDTLKKSKGGDIIAYGGATFVSHLIKEGLVDEFYFLVDPSLAANGLPIFKELEGMRHLKLAGARPFECGIAVLHYKASEV